jgi:HSP20 family protein
MLVRRGTLIPSRTDRVAIDRLFDELVEGFPFNTTAWGGNGDRYPLVNSWEDEKNYFVEAELPGLTRQEIDVSVLGNELTLTGTHEASSDEDHKTFHRRERHTGKFERILRFPVDIDDSKIEASFQDGVLKITLPKVQAALPRKVEVKG